MSDDGKKDLTRIEDLGEFLHDPNAEGEEGLEDFSAPSVDLDDLDNDNASTDGNDIPNNPDEEFVIDLSTESGAEEPGPDAAELSFDEDPVATETSPNEEQGFTATEANDFAISSENSEENTENEESLSPLEASQDFLTEDPQAESFDTPETEFSSEFSPIEDSSIETTPEESPEEDLETTATEHFDFNANEEQNDEQLEEQSEVSADFGETENEVEDASQIDQLELNDSEQQVMEENRQAASSQDLFTDDQSPQETAPPPPETPPPAASRPRENFEDLRKFGEAITYGEVKAGGNPPYALIIKNIRSKKDKQAIKELLDEHKLTLGEMGDVINTALEQGALLLSQLSEYSAIYLAHRLRLYDVDIQFGLSEKMHLSKNYQSSERGLVSHQFTAQSKSLEVDLSKSNLRPEDLIAATVPMLAGKKILHYYNIISAFKNISLQDSEHEQNTETEVSLQSTKSRPWYGPGIEPDENYELASSLNFQNYFDELTDELKLKAYKLGANAVVAISFQLTPLTSQNSSTTAPNFFRLVAIGNAVYLVDNENWEANA